MTVTELISQLQALPQNAKCLIYSPDAHKWITLASIEHGEKFDDDVVYLQTEFDTF